ncbi:protein of unknown function [Bradyrhizobium vignae]|uniref:Uncharacterized protein n=1 Tax=Bradyrhizobium vignae TaxID=1549949 RepID=A0A2U3PRQ1_9BRAD|nr:protein of unknown function [Bradyrhizobium vignae]
MWLRGVLGLQGFDASGIGTLQFHFQDSVESPDMIRWPHRRWRCDRRSTGRRDRAICSGPGWTRSST